MMIGNAPVTNYEQYSYSSVNLVTATAKSINTVFGQAAVEMGSEKLVNQARSFGFNQEIPFDLSIRTSLMPDPAVMTTWETAWAGIGQPVGEHEEFPPGPQATVYQMALVAAGIANDGVIMRPFIIDHILSSQGSRSIMSQTRPQQFSRAADRETVALVQDAMVETIKSGSGAAASVPGVQIAGKTGTAEVGAGRESNSWFIAYAPAENPTVAVAVLIEGGGLGGRAAAPAARPVLEAALNLNDD
jgi:peptidoglycan glycosyltransferase